MQADKARAVYGSTAVRQVAALALLCLGLVLGGAPAPAAAQTSTQAGDALVVAARDALRRKDRAALASARATSSADGHPLAGWVAYWELGLRLNGAQQDELDAFYARWSGTYVEDRLRNDWLLELGKRRDWKNFATEFPRFRMNDDREVTCYALLVDHLAGKPVRDAALAAWLAQREADDGCLQLASTLLAAKVFKPADAWRKARAAVDAGRQRTAAQALELVDPAQAAGLQALWDQPARHLAGRNGSASRNDAELSTLALMRLAALDAPAAAAALTARWDKALPAELASIAWATTGKRAALNLQPDAADHYQRAQLRHPGGEADWPDDTLAWKVRAALRADGGRTRWQQVVQAVGAMEVAEQADPAWVYWRARALAAIAGDSQDSETLRELARDQLSGIAGQLHFYGKLAAEHIGQPLRLPPRPQPLSDAERAAARAHAGMGRALRLIALGLRNEGVREWNFSLRGMAERELLAAAQLACEREVWDRCINTSERTRDEVDMNQRFPTPHRQAVEAMARESGVDTAYVYGLIRQESRFITDARSGVGASGLMQVMPATARWTARKIGLDWKPELITDRDVNLRVGTSYLKLVLDDFDGSQPMAAAAYNAGPGRPRKWREGGVLEPAAWAETIPFTETRDYVKKVLSNATWYAALMTGQVPSLAARLGGPIGPRAETATTPNKDLP